MIKAVILAGGKGTRLWPLTKDIPKPLIKINGLSVLEYCIELLKTNRILPQHIIVSLLHQADKFITGIKEPNIIYDIQNKDYGTAGAVLHTFKYLNHPFTLVINGDTITNLNILMMLSKHLDDLRNQVTIFSQNDAVHNGGVYLFNTKILGLIPSGVCYSLHKEFVPKLEENNLVQIYNPPSTYYFDVGSPVKLKKAKEYFEK